eukprot:3722966-Rhodomonas_salina.1
MSALAQRCPVSRPVMCSANLSTDVGCAVPDGALLRSHARRAPRGKFSFPTVLRIRYTFSSANSHAGSRFLVSVTFLSALYPSMPSTQSGPRPSVSTWQPVTWLPVTGTATAMTIVMAIAMTLLQPEQEAFRWRQDTREQEQTPQTESWSLAPRKATLMIVNALHHPSADHFAERCQMTAIPGARSPRMHNTTSSHAHLIMITVPGPGKAGSEKCDGAASEQKLRRKTSFRVRVRRNRGCSNICLLGIVAI